MALKLLHRMGNDWSCICEQGGLVLRTRGKEQLQFAGTSTLELQTTHRIDFVGLGSRKTPEHNGCNRPGWSLSPCN